MHKGMIGKIGPASVDVTLGDYIARKQQAAAFDSVAQENKLSFEQWFKQINEQHGLPPAYTLAKWAWRAGQENK
jgi:hypothetical protein